MLLIVAKRHLMSLIFANIRQKSWRIQIRNVRKHSLLSEIGPLTCLKVADFCQHSSEKLANPIRNVRKHSSLSEIPPLEIIRRGGGGWCHFVPPDAFKFFQNYIYMSNKDLPTFFLSVFYKRPVLRKLFHPMLGFVMLGWYFVTAQKVVNWFILDLTITYYEILSSSWLWDDGKVTKKNIIFLDILSNPSYSGIDIIVTFTKIFDVVSNVWQKVLIIDC